MWLYTWLCVICNSYVLMIICVYDVFWMYYLCIWCILNVWLCWKFIKNKKLQKKLLTYTSIYATITVQKLFFLTQQLSYTFYKKLILKKTTVKFVSYGISGKSLPVKVGSNVVSLMIRPFYLLLARIKYLWFTTRFYSFN